LPTLPIFYQEERLRLREYIIWKGFRVAPELCEEMGNKLYQKINFFAKLRRYAEFFPKTL
jgi:hypothetical protein